MEGNDKIYKIGLIGEMGNGKTTVARTVIEIVGNCAARVGLAEGVRQELSARYNIPIEETRTLEQKNRMIPELGITVGQALQKIGDEGRAEDPFKWIKKLELNIIELKKINPALRLVLIDDVRYLNECDWIKKDDHGEIWKVTRPAEMKEMLFDSRDPNHASETELRDYKGICTEIINKQTMDELKVSSLGAICMFIGSCEQFSDMRSAPCYVRFYELRRKGMLWIFEKQSTEKDAESKVNVNINFNNPENMEEVD